MYIRPQKTSTITGMFVYIPIYVCMYMQISGIVQYTCSMYVYIYHVYIPIHVCIVYISGIPDTYYYVIYTIYIITMYINIH